MTTKSEPTYEGWAILELLGHRRLAGFLREQEIAGAAFIRIDVPAVGTQPAATQFYSPSAVYGLTPTTEAIARAAAATRRVEPVSRWDLEYGVKALATPARQPVDPLDRDDPFEDDDTPASRRGPAIRHDDEAVRRCRTCGCTDEDACYPPCVWVDRDLCSMCAKIMRELPTIVCLCGSTRFYQAFQEANFRETMAGRIVLSVGFYPHAQEEAHGEDVGVTPAEKEALDELHFAKIRLADEVLILNPEGYIGESTSRELAYARELGKRIRSLEPLPSVTFDPARADGPDIVDPADLPFD